MVWYTSTVRGTNMNSEIPTIQERVEEEEDDNDDEEPREIIDLDQKF